MSETTIRLPDAPSKTRQVLYPGATTGETRFPRQLIGSSYLDRLQLISTKTEVIVKRIQQDYQVRRLGWHGVVDRDPQYTIDVDFSDDDGQSFASPLFEIVGNRIYQIRARFGQLQAEPLLRGVGLRWRLPTGWSFTDGLGQLTYEELVSNPTTVQRTMRSPSGAQPAAFEIDVEELFRW